MTQPRTPLYPEGVSLPKDSASEKATRRFSKRVTVASLLALFGLAGYGTAFEYPHTAGVIDALGPWVLGLIITYMGVGHLDFRAVLGQSFGDVLKGLVRRRRDSGGDA